MKENNICDLCVSYVAGELSREQKETYASHLQHCITCSKEVDKMREAWSMLPFIMDELDVPASLKEETMQFVFPPQPVINPSTKQTQAQPRIWNVRWAAMAAIVVIITAVFNISMQWWPRGDNQDLLTIPASVVELHALSTVDSESDAGKGTACILQQGDKNQLIIYSWGLKATEEDEVYQVWYSHEGIQHNAGTFKVDYYGYGVLTFDLDQTVHSIDSIGITLEPNEGGNEPRGKKILASI